MNKQVLQIIIAVSLLVVGYLIYDGSNSESGSTIKISDPVITDTKAPEPEATPQLEPEVEDDTPLTEDEGISFSGVLLDFVDGKDEFLGAFKYALVDDGTEIIRVDLRSIVGYDVTELESDLGVTIGERVTVKGFLEDGEFVATYIKAE